MRIEQTSAFLPEPKRYAALDTWRFLAAIGVVAYHYENHFASIAAQPTHNLTLFGHLVDFFFVLSGFVLMHTYGGSVRSISGYGSFIRKRLARIYPLHAVVTLIFAATAIVVTVAHIKLRDPATLDTGLVAPHLLLVHAWGFDLPYGLNFPSWSISAELFVYLLYPLLALLVLRYGPILALALALSFAIAMETIRFHLGMRSFTLATSDFGMLRAVPLFLAGMAVQAIVSSLPRIRLSWWIAHAAMALLFVLLALQAHIYFVLCYFVFAIGVLAIVERGGEKSILQHRFCVMLGDASYAVYLLHTMFQVATLALARKLGITSGAGLIVLATLGTLLIVTCSVLCYRLFENPARRYLSRPLSQWFSSSRSAQWPRGAS